MTGPDGVVLVDKPAGITSHTAVARVRRALGQRRIGHCGTLDPAATGLLLMGIGSGTRLLQFLTGLDKTYSATIRLGVGTVSHDADSAVISTPGCPAGVDPAPAMAALSGPIRQRPPAVSAIKVAGRRSHERVRRGEAVELAEREAVVHSFQLMGRRDGQVDGVAVTDLDVVVSVSSGTYIRALARDLAAGLGTAGHLTALRRLRVGPFRVEDALRLQDVTARTALLPLAAAAQQVLPVAVLDDGEAGAAAHGRRIPAPPDAVGPTACLDREGRLVAVATPAAGLWHYDMVVPRGQPAAVAVSGSPA
jgi:tRNA pseudouridine55 synthase